MAGVDEAAKGAGMSAGVSAAKLPALPARLEGVTGRDLIESETVSLQSRSLTDADCAAIAQYLKCNRVLRELDMSFNSFGDEGTRQLCESLAEAQWDLGRGVGQKLRVLSLRGCGIGASAAPALAELIRKCPALEEIGLDGNQFSDSAAEALLLALRQTTSLKHLYMSTEAMSEAAKSRLWEVHEQRPGLAIHFGR